MENNFFEEMKYKLKKHSLKIRNLNQWLFVTTNTSKAIIDNTDKSQLSYLNIFIGCTTTREIQQLFDTIQGKFGNDNFSQRHNIRYQYLCSLVANFPLTHLSILNQSLIIDFINIDNYLLYEI